MALSVVFLFIVVESDRSLRWISAEYNGKNGDYIARFGAIGQGPTEIFVGCLGNLSKRCFSVLNSQASNVMKYSLDSLSNGKMTSVPVRLTKYDIPDMEISELIAIDDTTFLCAGTY